MEAGGVSRRNSLKGATGFGVRNSVAKPFLSPHNHILPKQIGCPRKKRQQGLIAGLHGVADAAVVEDERAKRPFRSPHNKTPLPCAHAADKACVVLVNG